jgi:hypothetical protein
MWSETGGTAILYLYDIILRNVWLNWEVYNMIFVWNMMPYFADWSAHTMFFFIHITHYVSCGETYQYIFVLSFFRCSTSFRMEKKISPTCSITLMLSRQYSFTTYIPLIMMTIADAKSYVVGSLWHYCAQLHRNDEKNDEMIKNFTISQTTTQSVKELNKKLFENRIT